MIDAFTRWKAARDARVAAAQDGWATIREKYQLDDVADDVGDCVCPGWLAIIDDMIADMIAAGWGRRGLTCIKSTGCELVVYYERGSKIPEPLRRSVEKAQRRAAESCEYCGRPHGQKVPRSGQALCAECRRSEEALTK